MKAHTQTASDYRTLRDPCNKIGLYAHACSKQSSDSLTSSPEKPTHGASIWHIPTPPCAQNKRNQTKPNRICPKWNETERRNCRKRQTNGTLITVSPNKTEQFWKRFFDAYSTCLWPTAAFQFASWRREGAVWKTFSLKLPYIESYPR